MIWSKEINIDKLNEHSNVNLSKHLKIRLTEIGDDYLEGIMPISSIVHQPYGVLHGGASCVLAETLGSIAANCCLDIKSEYAVGLEINANHIRPVSDGEVKGVAKAVHIGKKTHIWEIKITNENNQLVCISRLTMAVLKRAN